METKRITIVVNTDADNNPTRERTFLLEYDGILKVQEIVVDEDGTESVNIVMIQSYKTNPNGTKSDWVDAADAFDWFEEKTVEMKKWQE